MKYWIYDDGGRAAAGYKGLTGDCGLRAMAIACEIPYKDAYALLKTFASLERKTKKRTGKSSMWRGIYVSTYKKMMNHLGWEWTPLCKISTKTKTHLRADELPEGKIICRVSNHYVAVIDGVIHDIYDCSRNGTRLVYGYWRAKV